MKEGFEEYLRKGTNLSEGSIKLYCRIIRDFFKDSKVISVERLNQYITDHFRESSSYYSKYAFRHYLDFIDRPELYEKLVKVKSGPKKRLGKYFKKDTIKKIILQINDPRWRDVATLQYAMGCRAREIIALKEENIDLDYNEKAIRVRIEGKGGKSRPAVLSRQYEPILSKYMLEGQGYLFIEREAVRMPEEQRELVLENNRAYYYRAVRKAAHELGLEFGTHDFRRNFAEDVFARTKDLRLVKRALGHSNINTTMQYFADDPKDLEDAFLDQQE